MSATLHTDEGCQYLRDIVGSKAAGKEAFLPYPRRQPPSIRNAIRRLLCSKLAVSVHSRGLFPIILFVFPRCGMLAGSAVVIPGLVCKYVLLFKQNLADHSSAADSLPSLKFQALQVTSSFPSFRWPLRRLSELLTAPKFVSRNVHAYIVRAQTRDFVQCMILIVSTFTLSVILH